MINIASTFTADVMSSTLQFMLQKFCNQDVRFYYNQIFQQIIFENSEFHHNLDGMNVILMRMPDLFGSSIDAQKRLCEFIHALVQFQKTMRVPLAIFITPIEILDPIKEAHFLDLERQLKEGLQLFQSILLITSDDIQHESNLTHIFDQFTEKYGNIPYTMNFYNDLSLFVARKYSLLTRKPYKVIVLDCDGTLWDGIVEEDGVDGIKIDAEYFEIQSFMIELQKLGFLVCLCSKNSEKSILNVFKEHTGMALNLKDHICSYRINWEAKSANIQSLAKELEISLDSVIFIDDSKLECAEVKSALPDVFVINLPEKNAAHPGSRLQYLKSIWAFDVWNKTNEDIQRTAFYQQNKFRHQLKEKSTTFEQFLKNLNIKISIHEATVADLTRVIQLSQRTNQFNLFPNSISAIEFEHCIQNKKSHCLVIEVADKYGDYGLVGVVVYDIQPDELLIKSFFLSCRILGRGIEFKILKYLSKKATTAHVKQVRLLFRVTEKNIPGIAFVRYISGLDDLSDLNDVLVSSDELQRLKPSLLKTNHNKEKGAQTESKDRTANDYMLDIAQYCVSHRGDLPYKNSSNQPSNEMSSIQLSVLEILKQRGLLIDDVNISFVDLGIDSLRSVLISSDIYQRFQVEMHPFDLLQPNFTLDQFIQQVLHTVQHIKKEDHQPKEVTSEMSALSYAQRRIWYEEKLFPNSSSKNNIFIAYEISCRVDIHAMEQSILKIIASHDALRFSFFEHKNEPFIKLNAPQAIHFKMDHVRHFSDKDLNGYVTRFKYESFDLLKAPLFRVSLIHLKNGKTIFLFCIHHIIHDGWSLNMLLTELSQIYSAYMRKIPIPIQNDSAAYLDFIVWQKDNISHNVLAKQRDFWKNHLDKLQKLELIYDKVRKDNLDEQRSKRVNFKVSRGVTSRLKKMSVHHQVTLYDLLMSAFGLFLSHYSNQKDVSFITAVSGRHHPHVAGIIGFFVNLLLIRFHIHEQEYFGTLLKKNKKILKEVFENQDLPFNEMMQLIGEAVNSKSHVFSQAGFIFQNYPVSKFELNGERCHRVFSDDKAELIYDACNECRFGNLVCYMQEYDSELHGLFEYNTSLFHATTIKHMIMAFKSLLHHIVEEVACPALSIPLVDIKHNKNTRNPINRWTISDPEHATLLLFFSQQVIAHPDAIAVKHRYHELTYMQLDKTSNQLARKLCKMGITKEMPIGIFLENSVDRIIAMLGILKAGGCYVPLEIDLPVSRMSYIIADAEISVVIVSPSTLVTMHAFPVDIKTVFVTSSEIQVESDSPLDDVTSLGQLSYILYTSGSTGKPKGVAIEQRGIVRLVKSPNYVNIQSSDHIAQTSSFIFDAATFEIWGALLNGGTLFLIDKKILLDSSLFATFLTDSKITILFLTTQLFHAYAYTTPHLFQNLRYLIVGGEAVLAEAIRKVFRQKRKPHIFVNGYGPTENTTFSTTYSVKGLRDITDPVPIGKPITGTTAYVLGSDLNPRPVGAPGKLYVGGIGLARYYLNQDQLNDEKFIYLNHERLYDTGDIVVRLANGHLKFIGREDNQIKINGYRIELSEIEAQLKTHPLIKQAIVLVKNTDHDQQLHAYILLQEGNSLLNVNLYHYLRAFYPNYMIPKLYYQIVYVPLTDNGKVDKHMLSQSGLHPVSYTEYESPSSLLHDQLISIYADILHINKHSISVNAEFFDLGGTSISALTLINKVNEQFNVKINFSILYECASVKLLSEKIDHLLLASSFSSTVDLEYIYDSSLKMIKEGKNTSIPIVFLHPIGGTGFCYLDLIKLLPIDQTCYIIQDPSIQANQILFEDMTLMAQHYNHLLLKQMKASKFILAGYSFGGMLALEMTSQLQQKKLDDHIDFIISFDTWVVSDFMNVEAKKSLKASIMKQYNRVAKNLVRENIDPKPWMELYYCRLQDVGFAYSPPIVNKKIVLFKAREQSGEFSALADPHNFLNLHTTESVDVYFVSGNHDTILQSPNVGYIQNVLSDYLTGSSHELVS